MWRIVTISREVFIGLPHNFFFLWCLLVCRVYILVDKVRQRVCEFRQSIQLQNDNALGTSIFPFEGHQPDKGTL